MKKVVATLVLCSLAFGPLTVFAQPPAPPCEDPLFVTLKGRPLAELSEREFQYLMEMQRECGAAARAPGAFRPGMMPPRGERPMGGLERDPGGPPERGFERGPGGPPEGATRLVPGDRMDPRPHGRGLGAGGPRDFGGGGPRWRSFRQPRPLLRRRLVQGIGASRGD